MASIHLAVQNFGLVVDSHIRSCHPGFVAIVDSSGQSLEEAVASEVAWEFRKGSLVCRSGIHRRRGYRCVNKFL